MATSKKQAKRNEKGQLLPGYTANPNGRPKKGYSITEWFREMLDNNQDIKEELGQSILKKALQGDPTAQKLVWQYMDGMPVQTNYNTDVTVDDLIKAQEASASSHE